jgi:hypothetical protein
VVALAVPVLMRARMDQVHRIVEPGPRVPTSTPDPERIDQLGRWVDAIMRRGRPVVRPGCLTRGVTLYYALRREGLEVALCFGVGTDQGTTTGHCWLEVDGRPCLERTDPLTMFTEVVRMSPAGVTLILEVSPGTGAGLTLGVTGLVPSD